ncbi:MAG: hypothetical protein AB8B70_00185 [Prochlorococcus sp.]
MLVYLCLSSHGFGHASRQAAVLIELHRLRPDWRLVVSSVVDPRFLQLALAGIPFESRTCQWDVGVEQVDALGVDLQATLRSLQQLEQTLPELVEAEAAWLHSQQDDLLVLADIPPAAALLAARVGAALIWMGNFGWDEIYRPYGPEFQSYADDASFAYSSGALLLRCPFSLEMNWGHAEIELSLTAAQPKPLPLDFQKQLESDLRPTVLVGFGGLGLSINSQLFQRWPDHLFLLFPPASRLSCLALEQAENVLLLPSSVRSIDVMPFCTRLLGKPGFSSFSEALSQNLGLIIVERCDFAEVSALISGLRRHGHHRILSREALERGEWELELSLLEPSQGRLNCDGALRAAQAIIQLKAA